jgi:hypothetical protein
MTGRKRLPLGTIKTRVHTSMVKRRWIKVAHPNKWIRYTIYLWKKHYGKIPFGKVVHHKDGNPCNDFIENLELITREKHLDIHRMELAEKNKLKHREKIK